MPLPKSTFDDKQDEHRQRALVVEDDELVRALMAEILRTAGYSVFEAVNGADGLAQARAVLPDVVVTDIFMPAQDGIEVLREIKRELPATRVVAVSGGSLRVPQLDMLTVATKLGADATVNKPFTPTELLVAATAGDHGTDGKVISLNAYRHRPAGRGAQLPSKV